jgi:hypothetical protein
LKRRYGGVSGACAAFAIGSGKLLKHYGLPVLRLGIAGAYLTTTKYCMDERPGRVDVEVDLPIQRADKVRQMRCILPPKARSGGQQV